MRDRETFKGAKSASRGGWRYSNTPAMRAAQCPFARDSYYTFTGLEGRKNEMLGCVTSVI